MLKGTKISLRPMRAEDVDVVFEGFSSLENRGPYYPHFLESEHRFRKQFDEHGFWEDNKGLLVIVEPDGTVVGEIAYFPEHEDEQAPSVFELGYMLYGERYHGRGYMTEALELVVDHLFDTKPIARLVLQISPENEASKAVAKKAGFTFEGVARGSFYARGAHQDMEIWAILSTDPRWKKDQRQERYTPLDRRRW